MRSPLNWMLVLVPVAVALEWSHANPLYVFIASAAAIIPLAGWMGRSTEWMAEHFGSGIGGLLNATFGNAAELIIAIMALRAGLYDVVKASLTGSIIGKILLVFGLVVPAIFHFIVAGGPVVAEQDLSLEISIILMTTYVLSLVFTLQTHKHLYAGGHGEEADEALGTK